jgi:hypothetical protein
MLEIYIRKEREIFIRKLYFVICNLDILVL